MNIAFKFSKNIRMYSLFSKKYMSTILKTEHRSELERVLQLKPKSFTMKELIQNSCSSNVPDLYLGMRQELPVRIAKLISLTELFPNEVKDHRSFNYLQDYYLMSFKDVYEFPAAFDPGALSGLVVTLSHVATRLGGTTEMLSEAILTSLEGDKSPKDRQELVTPLQPLLKDLFRANLSCEVLIYVFLDSAKRLLFSDSFKNVPKPANIKPDRETYIITNSKIFNTIDEAYQDARYLCEEHYMSSPDLEILGPHKDLALSFIPSNLYLIFFELLKNSLKATVEFHGEDKESYPPVKIMADIQDHHLTLTLEDEGGGLPPTVSPAEVFQFFFTSSSLNKMSLYQGAFNSPLAGHGFGLGMGKIYSEYFGGKLEMETSAGRGSKMTFTKVIDPNLAREVI